MRRYFYVDTENLGPAEWLPYFDDMSKQDTVILMVSEKSGKLSIDDAVKKVTRLCNRCNVECVDVHNGKQNALDFCLVAVLGTYVQRALKSEHIIISKDRGYDAVVDMFIERGIKVIRRGSYHNLIDMSSALKLKDMPEDFQSAWESTLRRLEKRKSSIPKHQYDSIVNSEYQKLKERFSLENNTKSQ